MVSLQKSSEKPGEIVVRQTQKSDFEGIRRLGRLVYPKGEDYSDAYLLAHIEAFPEGQFVAVDVDSQQVLGMATTLIVDWDDYDIAASWSEITGEGLLTTHNPAGRTLYGADVMVHPKMQGRGIGQRLYSARRDLAIRLKMIRIRAGARLAGYHNFADRMSPEEYALKVVKGEVRDPTLSFQLRRGFHVIAVIPDYLSDDPECLNNAAFIEWINQRVARQRHYAGRDPRFEKHLPMPPPEVVERSQKPSDPAPKGRKTARKRALSAPSASKEQSGPAKKPRQPKKKAD
jgi:GNAT superfamily N-acetyltransferase